MSKTGKRIDISITISPIRDASNRVIGASKVARDISAQRQAEQALRDADRRKDEFLATLAHELRNPLAPICNSLHILRRMGETLARDALAGLDDAAVRASCRGHLVAAYNDFVTRSPLDERVFKVLKDAVKPRRGAFVPLEALSEKKNG